MKIRSLGIIEYCASIHITMRRRLNNRLTRNSVKKLQSLLTVHVINQIVSHRPGVKEAYTVKSPVLMVNTISIFITESVLDLDISKMHLG